MLLTDARLQEFRRRGYLRLGRLLCDEELRALRVRINEIMLGSAPVPYDRMLMQLDPATNPPQCKRGASAGHKGATLAYRKIQDLELDPLFRSYLQRPLFAELCRRIYGAGRAISCFRAMFMNKPAGAGTDLRWHQDRWVDLDRDPQITVWTALDPASTANGCMQIVPGSHRRLRNARDGSGFLSDEQRAELERLIDAGDPQHCPDAPRSWTPARRCCCTTGPCTGRAPTPPPSRGAPSASATWTPPPARTGASRFR